MCLGLPMTVLSVDGITAVVEGWGEQRVVGTLLVGDVTPGVVVLVHLRDAVRVLDAEEAGALTEAVHAIVGGAQATA
jgi:hydrogenase expression/formation protein HypC